MNNVFTFDSGYRAFSSPWWKHWLHPRTYYMPFVWGFQRVTRGWADCDTWGMDSWLAEMLPEALQHLRENKQGTPMDFSTEEWDSIMAEMIEGFRAYKRSDDIPDEFVQKLETSTGWRAQLGVKDSEYDWDKIRDYQETELALFHKGMALFTKYFGNLWA